MTGRTNGGGPDARRPEPPRLARRLLARAVPSDRASGPSLLGDLHEEFTSVVEHRGRVAGKLWYTAQAVRIALPYLGLSVAEGARGTGTDLRLAARALRSAPMLSITAVLSLALGVGLATSVSGVIHGIWFAPLPYPHAERLVDVEDDHPVEVCQDCSAGASYLSYLEWRAEVPAFEALAGMSGETATLSTGDRRRSIRIAAVTGNLSEVLGVGAALGRLTAPGDDDAGAPRVIVLGHALWARDFAGDADAVGRTVRLDGVPHTVIGVLERDTRLLDRSEAWIPLDPESMALDYEDRSLWVVGRLADGVTAESADASLSAFASRRYLAAGLDRGWSARVRPLRDVLENEAPPRTAAVALLAATLLVLLISSMNLAALLLARATEREHELVVRAAIGSGRARLLRYASMESVLLAVAGGALGLVVADGVMSVLGTRLVGVLPGWMHFSLDARVLGVAVALTGLTAVVCATLPLAHALEIRPGLVAEGLGRTRSHRRLRRHDFLLGAQVTLGVVLVTGTATSLQTFRTLSDLDTLGFRTDGLTVLTASLDDGASGGGVSADVITRLRSALSQRPAIGAVTVSAPLFLGSWGGPGAGSPVWVEGAAEPVSNATVPRHSLAIGPDYFRVHEIPILAGREMVGRDLQGGAAVAVVSRDAGAILWPNEPEGALVGKRLRLDDGADGVWFTVVGVATDVVTNYSSQSRRTQPRIYTSLVHTPATLLRESPGRAVSFVFESGGGGAGGTDWDALVRSVDEEATLASVRSLAADVGIWVTPVRVTTQLLSALSALAIALLLVGVYGTLSYRIAAQRFDLGVRVALGGTARAIVGTLTKRLAQVLGGGLLLGAAVSLPIGSGTAGSGVPLGGGLGTVAAVALALVALAAVGCLVPLARALRIDPAESLRPR